MFHSVPRLFAALLAAALLSVSISFAAETDSASASPAVPETSVSITSGQTQPDAQTPQQEMVWVSATGKRFHKSSACSNMKSPSQMPRSQAESRGLTPCKKCC